MIAPLNGPLASGAPSGPALLSHARLVFWAHGLLHLVRPPGVWLIAPMLVVMSAPLREDRGTLLVTAGTSLALAGPTATRAMTEAGTVHAIDTGPALLTALGVLVAALISERERARRSLFVAAASVVVFEGCVCEVFVGVQLVAVLASALWGVVSAALAGPLTHGLTRLSRLLAPRRRAIR